MSGYDVAALATLALCLVLVYRALQWAEKPRNDWSSQTYGEDVSQLDQWDYAHRPWGPAPEKFQTDRQP